MTTGIKIKKAQKSALAEFNFDQIPFGHTPTDHMLVSNFADGEWNIPLIEPFHNLSLSPMALCFHYGQTVFEGFKAYRLANGDISIFRPYKHHERLNRSLDRMCMPVIPQKLFIDGVQAIVEVEQDWISGRPGYSLYLRPIVIATEARLGVKISEEYSFIIICTPMANYFTGNLKLKVETEFVRAVAGGAGFAKCGGNYGAAFYPTKLAREQGFDQVLWTDGKENKYIEESGMMNFMMIVDEVLVTPPLSGTILDGITRDSILTLARDAGIRVEERPISYLELEAAFKAGKTIEAFGVGTAAVVTPIELINIEGKDYYPDVSSNARLYKFKQQLNDIRTGVIEDKHAWNYTIPINTNR